MSDHISPPVIGKSEWRTCDVSLVARASQLYAVYAWAIDNGDFHLLQSLLGPKISISINDTEHEGLDAFLQVYRNNWAADWTAAKHYISNIIASEDAAGNIRSRAYFQAVFMRSNTTHMLVGRYDDTLVVIDGDLRIQQKRLFIEGSIDLPETSREISRFSPFARVK